MKTIFTLSVRLAVTLFALQSIIATNTAIAANERNAKDSKVLATVNNREITSATLAKYSKRRGMPKDADVAQQQQAMLEELINRELIYLDAVKNGVDKKPNVKSEIENQRINIIASAMLQDIAKAQSISDQDLKKEYEKFTAEMQGKEYKASHILVENEKDAKSIISELDKGANFSELAKKKSTGPSGANGGDLGWFKPAAMVKPFSDEVKKLKDGNYTKSPVKTQFGWHIILRVASRDIQPPLFDTLKEQIRMRLQNQQIESYIASLRSNADIKKK